MQLLLKPMYQDFKECRDHFLLFAAYRWLNYKHYYFCLIYDLTPQFPRVIFTSDVSRSAIACSTAPSVSVDDQFVVPGCVILYSRILSNSCLRPYIYRNDIYTFTFSRLYFSLCYSHFNV